MFLASIRRSIESRPWPFFSKVRQFYFGGSGGGDCSPLLRFQFENPPAHRLQFHGAVVRGMIVRGFGDGVHHAPFRVISAAYQIHQNGIAFALGDGIGLAEFRNGGNRVADRRLLRGVPQFRQNPREQLRLRQGANGIADFQGKGAVVGFQRFVGVGPVIN